MVVRRTKIGLGATSKGKLQCPTARRAADLVTITTGAAALKCPVTDVAADPPHASTVEEAGDHHAQKSEVVW
jgi:hypothetical protein